MNLSEIIVNGLKEKQTDSSMTYLMAVSEQTSMAKVIGEDGQKHKYKSKVVKKKGETKK